MPLHHFNIAVPQDQVEGLVTFVKASLAHLDFKEFTRFGHSFIGLGDTTPFFWIYGIEGVDVESQAILLKSQHIAFLAKNIDEVKQFYDAALKAGGIDNGPPGPRSHYSPTYYGAFVRDPGCGINFEVLCHTENAK